VLRRCFLGKAPVGMTGHRQAHGGEVERLVVCCYRQARNEANFLLRPAGKTSSANDPRSEFPIASIGAAESDCPELFRGRFRREAGVAVSQCKAQRPKEEGVVIGFDGQALVEAVASRVDVVRERNPRPGEST
jgi:hypothetical protein